VLKLTLALTMALMMTAGLAPAQAQTRTQTEADIEVQVSLSPALQKQISRIDRVEQIREVRFRKYQHYDRFPVRSPRRFANSRYRDVAWANELLIPDAAAYSVENLLAALVRESLNRTNTDPGDAIIRIRLDKLRVKNHSVAVTRGISNFAKGEISLVDAATGEVLRSLEVRANLVTNPTVDLGYKGPDFAFEDTDPDRRVGPVLAYFVKKGLEGLYPGTEFPRPVAVIF
jgi:hypothetical protein